MRKVPRATTDSIEAAVQRTVRDYLDQRPAMLLMYEHVALVNRDRQMAFMKAGFTESQAFELCRDK